MGWICCESLSDAQPVAKSPSDASAISERSIADAINAITSLWCAEASDRVLNLPKNGTSKLHGDLLGTKLAQLRRHLVPNSAIQCPTNFEVRDCISRKKWCRK
jgi:hypothetical protein